MSQWKSLNELIAWVKNKRQEAGGVICPCCGQLAKVYKRNLSYPMIKTLKEFYDAGPERFHHYTNVIRHNNSNCGDYTILKHFGLIEPEDTRIKERNASGHWRITKTGINFLFNRIALPKYVLIYNNIAIGTAGEFVKVKKCLGEKFDYAGLMEGVILPENLDNNQMELFSGGE